MEKQTVTTYKDLVVWQKGIELVNEIYVVTRIFPKEEMFGLTNQLRRAAISIPANIAEGWGRSSTKNYVQFIKISLGSLFELETLIIIAKDQNYLEEQIMNKISVEITEIGKMLNKLIHNLENYIKK
jgi:four helix bundle protein